MSESRGTAEEPGEWDRLTKKEMWDEIQAIRKLTDDDGTKGPPSDSVAQIIGERDTLRAESRGTGANVQEALEELSKYHEETLRKYHGSGGHDAWERHLAYVKECPVCQALEALATPSPAPTLPSVEGLIGPDDIQRATQMWANQDSLGKTYSEHLAVYLKSILADRLGVKP